MGIELLKNVEEAVKRLRVIEAWCVKHNLVEQVTTFYTTDSQKRSAIALPKGDESYAFFLEPTLADYRSVIRLFPLLETHLTARIAALKRECDNTLALLQRAKEELAPFLVEEELKDD